MEKFKFKVDWKNFIVIKIKNNENGSLRVIRHNLYRDTKGFYIGEKEKRTYLNHMNCINMIDI